MIEYSEDNVVALKTLGRAMNTFLRLILKESLIWFILLRGEMNCALIFGIPSVTTSQVGNGFIVDLIDFMWIL